MRSEPFAAIIAAMPEERRALLEPAQNVKKQILSGHPVYEGMLKDRFFCLIESGMGSANAARASAAILASVRPSILISAGFCGAVREGAYVADLVICDQLSLFDHTGLKAIPFKAATASAERIAEEFCATGLRAWAGSFITTETIVGKSVISQMLPDGIKTPVLEMESAAVARAASDAGIPFLGFRSVSDPYSEELGFSIDELTDVQMRICIPKVIATCIRKPQIIPQLARLASNSSKAGKTLSTGIGHIITLL